MGRRGKPITVRGVTYSSYGEAAEDIGVSRATLQCAVSRGTVEKCGLGKGQAKPITVRGVEYPSYAEAGRALGVSPNAVKESVVFGYEDRLGLGRRRKGVPFVTTAQGWRLYLPTKVH